MMMMMSFNLNHVMSLVRRKIEGSMKRRKRTVEKKSKERRGSKEEGEIDDIIFMINSSEFSIFMIKLSIGISFKPM